MKKHLICLRCGERKQKGFYELGCKVYGTYYKKHLFSTKQRSKVQELLGGEEE